MKQTSDVFRALPLFGILLILICITVCACVTGAKGDPTTGDPTGDRTGDIVTDPFTSSADSGKTDPDITTKGDPGTSGGAHTGDPGTSGGAHTGDPETGIPGTIAPGTGDPHGGDPETHEEPGDPPFEAVIPSSMSAKMNTDKILAPSYLLYDASRNELLYSSNIKSKIYPSGTTRLLTALVALSYLDENAVLTVSDELSLLKSGSDRAGLAVGDKLTVRDAVKVMLITTGNDAAHTVAASAGRIILNNPKAGASSAVKAFVDKMNAYAKNIGMGSSAFVNPDGYPSSGQYTTLHDMLRLTAKALENDLIRECSSTVSVSEKLANGKRVRWTNSNLLADPLSKYYREEIRGLSVGNSTQSGFCLASAACKDGKWLIALVYGAESSDIRFSDASLLYDLGFKGVADDKTGENTWIVACNEYISLRADASFSSDTVVSIKKGEQVILHGFKSRFAYVTYQKKNSSGNVTRTYRGYALSAFIVRPDEYSYLKDLDIVTPKDLCSYEQMNSDLEKLSKKYPDMLELSSIGKSEQGRELVLAVMGSKSAKYSIFVTASLHAREYMSTELVMAQIDYMLSHQDSEYANSGRTIGEILSETRFYIVPMANPDGVTISQTGVVPEQFKGKYSAYQIKNWKANANGIDLNANFDAMWENYSDTYKEPGPMGYKGDSPECAAETRAIASFLRSKHFDITISYHTTGSVIFWEFGDDAELNRLNRDYANRLCNFYGFTFYNQVSTSTAGLKDYAISKLGIVSLTIEVGTYDNPLIMNEFHNIWYRSRDTLLLSAIWLSEGDF